MVNQNTYIYYLYFTVYQQFLSGSIQAVYRQYTGGILAVCRQYTFSIQAVYREYTGIVYR